MRNCLEEKREEEDRRWKVTFLSLNWYENVVVKICHGFVILFCRGIPLLMVDFTSPNLDI